MHVVERDIPNEFIMQKHRTQMNNKYPPPPNTQTQNVRIWDRCVLYCRVGLHFPNFISGTKNCFFQLRRFNYYIITRIINRPKPLCPQTDEHSDNDKTNILRSYKKWIKKIIIKCSKNKFLKSYLPQWRITKPVYCNALLCCKCFLICIGIVI